MKVVLNQTQRIATAIIYLAILVIIFQFVGVGVGSLIWETSNDYSVWFYSGALLTIMGKYVAQPFFTKPTDSITNSTAVLISLLTLSQKDQFLWYEVALTYAVLVLASSLISIALLKSEGENAKRIGHYAYQASTKLGDWSVIFSIVYLLAAISYFALSPTPDLVALVLVLAFWICIIFFDVIGKAVETISKLISKSKAKYITEELGKAIGCENPKLYKIELDTEQAIEFGALVTVQSSKNSKSIGLVININQLVGKKWIEVYLIEDKDDRVVQISTAYRSSILDDNSLLSLTNQAHKLGDLNLLPKEVNERIHESELFNEKERFVGYVDEGTNLGLMHFHLLNHNDEVAEGDIIETKIYTKKVLYQIIDGFTKEETLEKRDRYGYSVGIARKLGDYNVKEKVLDDVKWIPNIYNKIFKFKNSDLTEESLIALASRAIGRLPNTDFEIPVDDLNSLITHNTAILGILGVGKSCMTFELIQKVLGGTKAKVICIDVSNQYKEKLPNYINDNWISDELPDRLLKELKATNAGTGDYDDPTTWGNEELYRKRLTESIAEFENDNEKRLLILNPDLHSVSKAGSQFKIKHKVDLTVAEKTRIVSERVFMAAREKGETAEARYLIVYEEAHSLVPEWGSVASDGDKNATNGTAKVILQGRKYGLGSFIVTQRTANVSKSILNQCNTMIAMRIFDDTGKNFLTNYFGSDYTNTLPNLEERHAVVTGKALRLRQPVILKLNEMKHVTQTKLQ